MAKQDKKSKTAVGLRYAKLHGEKAKGAPNVVVKGYNELAEEIIATAKAHNILVHEDPELADFLQRLEVGDEIPPALYVLVAEIIAFATWLDLKA
ncbi:MAG: EscU/YscU/HrcU family type III secretion system export apparatus switch protein [Firmicutes bacterium]|nr:EscU/YscU/HrcU family type III secretion system export apparatus switch protein [Bacillota bacterium]